MFGGKRFGREGEGGGGGFRRGPGGGGGGFRPRDRGPGQDQRFERRAPPVEHGEHPMPAASRVVIPGEMLSDTPKPVPYGFTDKGRTYSSVMGLFDAASNRLVPLEGCYMPNLDDTVVGVVTYVKFSGYTVDLKSPYTGFLSSKETREEYKLGDIIAARVKEVDEAKNVDLTEASKLERGEIVEIHSVKIPRVIGKSSSMIRMIQDAAKSEVIVGKNGRIWLRGGNTALAVEAILKIEKEAHTHGLTDRVSALLKQGAPGAAPAV